MKLLTVLVFALLGLSVPAAAYVGSDDRAVETLSVIQHRPAREWKPGLLQLAQATTNTTTQTKTPTEPTSVTTIVKGGTLAADVLEWLKVILVPVIGGALVGIAYRIMSWFGLKVEESNKIALQAVIVNGLNQAANKAEVALRTNKALDIDVKNQIIADAVKYTQEHARETIKALGVDSNDPEAVEGIRARIQTAIIDPMAPTNPALNKIMDKPSFAGVPIEGTKV